MELPNKDQIQERFLELYEPNHIRLSRFVQTLVWNKEDAKDIVSETILIAFEKFDQLKHPEMFLSFLFGISSRLIKNKNRRLKFKGMFFSKEAQEKTIEETSHEGLMKKELYRAIDKLNHKQKEVIILFEISGFSIREIAEVQGMSESGVKSNLTRGREKLALLLKEPLVSDPLVRYPEVSFVNERSMYEK